MTDREKRELEALRQSYAAIDFGKMTPYAVYASFVGDKPVHVLTADPAEYVRTSPYCTDLTDVQRADVIAKLRAYLDDQTTGPFRDRLRARIGICADYLGRHVPVVREMAEQRRIPHETLRREIRGLRDILDRLDRHVQADAIMPTDPKGIEWVEVVTQYRADWSIYRGEGPEYEIEARVYLEPADADDSDVVDVVVTSLDDDDERDKTVDPDTVFVGARGRFWRDAVREAGYEKALELGKVCAICGEVLVEECDCFAAEAEKEAAHA
jgi:hypothetical protein